MERALKTPEELEQFAKEFIAGLSRGERATVIGLSGELGAGKTSFVQGVAEALGVKEHVGSPTFVLEKRYPLSGASFSTLVHIDAYRLEGEKSAAPLRLGETLADPSNLVFIEWPEHVKDALPPRTKTLFFEVAPGGGRIVRE